MRLERYSVHSLALGRVLLVDDNEDLLQALWNWLVEHTTLRIVGAAHSGRDTIDRVNKLEPDLVVVDMTLSDMNGLELTRQIKSLPTPPLVVLITFHDSRAARQAATAAGVDAWVLESQITERLVPTIEHLLRLHAIRH